MKYTDPTGLMSAEEYKKYYETITNNGTKTPDVPKPSGDGTPHTKAIVQDPESPKGPDIAGDLKTAASYYTDQFASIGNKFAAWDILGGLGEIAGIDSWDDIGDILNGLAGSSGGLLFGAGKSAAQNGGTLGARLFSDMAESPTIGDVRKAIEVVRKLTGGTELEAIQIINKLNARAGKVPTSELVTTLSGFVRKPFRLED